MCAQQMQRAQARASGSEGVEQAETSSRKHAQMRSQRQHHQAHTALATIPASCRTQMHRTVRGTRERACRSGTSKNASLAKHAPMHSLEHHQQAHTQPGHTFLPASLQTRHPCTADAAHRHARAGLRERNGPKPTRGARAPRHATSQHRVGRRRRGSDEGAPLLLRF